MKMLATPTCPDGAMRDMADALPLVRTSPFDPPPELDTYRESEPLRRLAFPDGHVGWLATSHALVRRVLADRRLSNRLDLLRMPIPFDGFDSDKPVPGWFNFMDEPEHNRLRRPFMAQLTVRRLKALESWLESIVREHLDAMEDVGPPVDLVQAFGLPIPSLVICELLGVPYEDRAEFQLHSSRVLAVTGDVEKGQSSLMTLFEYCFELIQRKRAEPCDDMISGLVSSGEMSDEEIAGAGMLMLVAGHETTANMLTLGTYALLENPEQADALRSGAARVEDAVEELLRYLSVVHVAIARTAVEDVELDGQLIRRGETVALSLPAANRDSDRFDNPDVLDLSRSAAGHVAFGHGIHQCVGQQLARIEMRIAFPALLRRFPDLRLAVPPDEIRMRDDAAVYGVYELPVKW